MQWSSVADLVVDSVVICDDVRREMSGKDILIGVYGSEIVARALPGIIYLTLWVEFRPRKNGPIDLTIKLELPAMPQSSPILKMQINVVDHRLPSAFATPPIRCQIIQPGVLRISVKTDEDDRFKLVKTRRIRLDPASGTSAPAHRASSNPDPPTPQQP